MPHAVLIVDDSAITRALIKRTLKLTDLPLAVVHEASNGREALELMECLKVDLVLADLNMPEMNGFEMTRQMQLQPGLRDIPVILVSAEPNAEVFAATHDGIKGVVRKPFAPESIRNLLLEVLGAAHA